jgi:hypothetical protein
MRRMNRRVRLSLNTVGGRSVVWLVAAAMAAILGCVFVAAGGARVRAARGAVKLRAPGGTPLPGRWQSFADAALVPTVSRRVTVRLTRCPARPSAAGCVYIRRPRTIYLRPGLDDPRGVLLHELGHVYDLTVLNNRDRGHFRKLMHRRVAWWKGRLPLAEQFAEAYSWCARYARIVSIARYSSYDYRPTAKQHRRICALIRHAARDRAPAKPAPAAPVVTAPHAPPPPPPSTAPGTVPGDPKHDPGPQPPEDPNQPEPTPTPVGPLPLPGPTATPQPQPLPTPPPLPTPTPPIGHL